MADHEAPESIRRLLHDYAHGVDKRDLPRFLAVWAEDAVWSPGPGVEVTGREQITATIEGIWTGVAATHHFNANAVIDVDGDTATSIVDVNALAQAADGSWAQTPATYRDSFRRTADGWRITRRDTELHATFPISPPPGA